MSRPWLLAGGMFAGAALAVFYIVRVPDAPEETADAVAWVDAPMAADARARALAAKESGIEAAREHAHKLELAEAARVAEKRRLAELVRMGDRIGRGF